VIESQVVLVAERLSARGNRWVFVDAGRFNGLFESTGERIRYHVQTPDRDGPTGPVVLAGPTCDSADVPYERAAYRLPLGLQVGDRVRFLNAGAYAASCAAVEFNGFDPIATYCL
jgi:ornithine decarboxylase